MDKYTLAIVYNSDTYNSPTIGNAGQAWADTEHPNWGGSPIYVDVDDPKDAEFIVEFLEIAKIKKYPTVLMIQTKSDGQEIVSRKEGKNLSILAIKKWINQMLMDETNIEAEDGGGGQNSGGGFLNYMNGDFDFGFGNFKWLLLAGLVLLVFIIAKIFLF